MSTPAPDLIIFDMDGVLLDSEPMHRELNQQLFRELGAPVSDAEYETFVGMSTLTMWETVIATWDLPFTAPALQAREQELKHQGFRERPLVPSAGLVDLLRDLRAAGRKMAVASGSPGRNIAVVLARLDLTEYFDYVRSSETVAHGKPAPDLFLAVAEHFGLAPARCAVIEETPPMASAPPAQRLCRVWVIRIRHRVGRICPRPTSSSIPSTAPYSGGFWDWVTERLGD